jgi:hypothetical protein
VFYMGWSNLFVKSANFWETSHSGDTSMQMATCLDNSTFFCSAERLYRTHCALCASFRVGFLSFRAVISEVKNISNWTLPRYSLLCFESFKYFVLLWRKWRILRWMTANKKGNSRSGCHSCCRRWAIRGKETELF